MKEKYNVKVILGIFLALAVIFSFSVVPSAEAAWWNTSMTRWPILSIDNATGLHYINDSYGVDSGTGVQYIACYIDDWSETVYAYNDTNNIWYCANSTTQFNSFVDEGNGTDFGSLEDDLILWLTFNDTEDHSIYTRSETVVNNPERNITGKIGHAYDFENDDSDYITYNNSDDVSNGATGFTVTAWVKPETENVGNFIFLIPYTNTWSTPYDRIQLRDNNMEVSSGATRCGYNLNTYPPAGSWSMVTMVFDNGHQTFLLNAVNDTYAYNAGCTSLDGSVGTQDIIIGTYITGGGLFWDGLMDNVMVWNRTLTTGEIENIYNNTHPDTYWPLGAMEAYSEGAEFYATTQISPANATYVSTNPPGLFCFNYTGTYATASCELWIGSTGYGVNASTLNATDTCITANASVASDGTYDWAINCTNSTDYNTSATWEFYVDTTPPAVAYGADTTATTSCGLVDNIFINISASDTNLDNVSYSWQGTNSSSWNGTSGAYYWVNYTGLADGTYTFYVWANDSAGHYNLTASRTINIDTTPPQIVITEPLNQTYATAIEDLMFTSSDDYPPGYSWYTFNGEANVSTVRDEWTFIKHTDVADYFPGTSSTPSGSAWNGTHLFVGRTSSSFLIGAVDIFSLDGIDISWERNFSTVTNGPQHLWDQAYNDNMLYMTNWTGLTGSKEIYVYYTNGTYNTSYATAKEPIAVCSVDGEDYIYIMQNDIGGDKIYERWKDNGTATGVEYASDASITDPAMACDSDYFWVTDTGRDVWKYYRNGTFIDKVRPGDTTYIFPLKTSHYLISASLLSAFTPTDYIDFYYADTHINATLTVPQGVSTVTVYANDSCGNLNSSTVSFYVDTHAPTISGVSQTPITCVPSPGLVRMEWQQQDNLDDLTVYCNFTNAAGVSTIISSIIQTANATSSCSLLLASLGSWQIVVNITDYAGNTVLHTGSVESRATCSGEAGGGGGGGGVITSPIDVVITLFPESDIEGYTYEPITGRFIPEGISIEDLTPLQQFEAGILVPRFMQVCFDFNATGTDGQQYQLTHCALLFSISQIILTIIILLYMYIVWRRRKLRLQDWLMLALYIAYMFVSLTTAFPPEIINAMLGTGSFVPVVDVPTIATGPEVITNAPPAATADWGPALYEAIAGNPLAIIGTIIIAAAAWYIYRNQKESRKLAKRIKHFYER